jgi:hypothetical protein
MFDLAREYVPLALKFGNSPLRAMPMPAAFWSTIALPKASPGDDASAIASAWLSESSVVVGVGPATVCGCHA